MAVGTVLTIAGIHILSLHTIAMFRNSIEVHSDGQWLIGIGLYGQRKKLSLLAVASICPILGPAKTLEIRSLSNDNFRMRIDPAVIGFGELIEKILAKAENIRYADLGQAPNAAKYWHKSPDWDVIDAAIERAAANREAANAQRNH